MKNILKLENIEKIYGKKDNQYIAIKDISFEIKEGEFVGIMGPSGAGKSTLLNLVSGIDKPTNGSLLIDGEDITKFSDDKLSTFRRDKLGFIFQDFNLLDTLNIKDNIALPLAIANIDSKEINDRIDKISKILNINNLLNKYPYEISGGQKQRAASARAIVTNPKLILADEPTGALDSKSSKELLESMENLNKDNDSTIMMVTHDTFSASYCERILFVKDGSIFTEISRGELTRSEFFKEIIKIQSDLENN